jgi:CheY-like chemotaxis protein
MSNKALKPIEIFLVEDNEDDVLVTQKSFELAKIKNNIHVATDGDEAIKILQNTCGSFDHYPRPDIN